MQLSRVDFDPQRRTAARWAASPHALHAAVMRACDPAEGERVLWRLDRHATSAELFIVSPRTPDPAELVREASDGSPGAFASADYDRFLAALVIGQTWNFRLTANPTYVTAGRATAPGQSRRGSVKPHVTADHQLGWFREKAHGSGFSMQTPDGEDTARLVHREVRTFHGSKDAHHSSRPITLSSATVEGVLQITDAQALRTSLTTGIGRAKGYGCGLLTLAR